MLRSDLYMSVAADYLTNGCGGCPFLMEDEENEEDDFRDHKVCDSVPLNCEWLILNRIFKTLEKEEKDDNEKDT